MSGAIYYNGKFYEHGQAVIPIYDRSIFFGDAVYDAMIGRNGRIFLSGEHFERLIQNAASLNIPIQYSLEELEYISYNVVKKSDLTEFFLYIQLSRCSQRRVHAYPDNQKSSLLITASPFNLKPEADKLKLTAVEDRRYGYCNIKTVNLLPAVLASRSAESRGFDEAVFHKSGTVTECAHSNISILKDGVLITHPDCELILPGIAKKHLLSACVELGIPTNERPFSLDELYECDEALVTSTTKICLAADELDGRRIGGRDESTLKMLQNLLFYEYAIWTM